MTRWLALVATAAVLLAVLPASAVAATGGTMAARPSPKPTPRPTPRPTARPTPRPTARPAPTPSAASAAKRARAARAAAARRLIQEARREIGREVADSLATVQQLSDALGSNADEQSQIESQIQADQAQIDALGQEIGQRDSDIQATQQRIQGEQADIAILVRELYERPDSVLLRLLKAGSVRGMVTEAGDMGAAVLRADTLRQRLSDDLDQLQGDQQDRQDALNGQTQAQADLAAALGQLQELAAQEQQLAGELQAAIRHGRSALAKVSRRKEKPSAAEKVESMLEDRDQDLISTSEQQVWQQEQVLASLDSPDGSSVAADASPGAPATASEFAWPIQGAEVTQGFGPTSLWLEPAMFGFAHFHTGLDLASPDTRVSAAAGGVVAAVGWGTSGYGSYVIIDHGGGLLTLYGHLATLMVRTGDRVSRGQQIGVEGSTGASTGVHLHFEVRLDGRPVDPTPYLPGAESG